MTVNNFIQTRIQEIMLQENIILNEAKKQNNKKKVFLGGTCNESTGVIV